MEDRRTALAIFLIIAVVMLYSEWALKPYSRPPGQQVQPVATSSADKSSNVTPTTAASVQTQVSQPTSSATGRHPTPAEFAASPKTVIENSKVIMTISHLGARIASLRLKEYQEHLGNSQPVDLVTQAEGVALPLGVYLGAQSDELVSYSLESAGGAANPSSAHYVVLDSQDAFSLRFRGKLPDNNEIEKIFHIVPGSYLFNLDVSLASPPADGASMWLEWTNYLTPVSEDKLNPKRFTLLTEAEKIKHISLDEALSAASLPIPARWLAFDDKYFATILSPSVKGLNVLFSRSQNLASQRARGDGNKASFVVYAGPKEYETLQATGLDLERSIDLGFFSFLAYPLLLLLRLFYDISGNYGLAIVLLTLLVKAAFLPLTMASMKSMKSMQTIQPEMAALRERIKDPTELNREMMALYKRHGVNPMGGCLPILIQIPVFFGLYSALQHAIELRHAAFALWINDLSAPERLELFGINVPVMILLMGAMMFLQQYLTPTPTMDPAQRKMMFWMTGAFTIGFLLFPFPAGLALYMLVNSAISSVQQSFLRSEKKIGPFQATALASIAIFLLAFVLTLI